MPAIPALLITLIVIVTSVSLPLERWPATSCLGILAFIGHTLCGVPLRLIIRRLAFFLPFMIMLAVSIPSVAGFQRGGELALLLLLRSTVSFLAVLWLTQVVPLPNLLKALRRLRVPPVMVDCLQFMFRYSSHLYQEFERMRLARDTRSFQRVSRIRSWLLTSQMLGMLLLRAINRAERVHRAVQARTLR